MIKPIFKFWLNGAPFPGSGYLAGTITDPGPPVATVPGLRVLIADRATKIPVGIVVADETSAWRLNEIDENRLYTAVTSDPNNNYNAARADMLVPAT